jgi:MFS family permease
VFELGIAGLVAAGLFSWFAEEQTSPALPRRAAAPALKLFPTRRLWFWFLGASFAFSLRDFTGSSMGTLGSLFLQQAHGLSSRETGFALSCIFLAAMVSNPLFGGWSDGGRIRWTSLVLTVAATMVFIFPRVPRAALIPVLITYGFFFIASYPITEAALMESVPDAVRGRVFGCFITISGFAGNLAHWVVGKWVKTLGPAASSPQSYYPIYTVLAVLVLLSLVGLACLHALRAREQDLGALPGPELRQAPQAEPV